MSEASAARTRILLVDDSVLMRKAASKMLGDEFDIVTASDGMEAWVTLQGDPAIQVVFTDLSMPRLDGFGLLERIRTAEDEGTNNMPVIVVTGADDDESARKKALDRGATDFITKPFTSVDLLARARAHANYRRIAKRLEQQSTRDPLTGLENKAGFLDRLQQDLAYMHRHGQPLSVVRMEIDGFKDLFLRHGKLVAEDLLQHVAQSLRQSIRKEDSVGRIGLSGFALSLPAGQFEGSQGLVERIRHQIAMGQGGGIAVTVSAAVLSPVTSEPLEAPAVMRACEELLLQALKAGGNRVVGRCDQPPEAEPDLEWSVEQTPAATLLEGAIEFDVRQMAALLGAAGLGAEPAPAEKPASAEAKASPSAPAPVESPPRSAPAAPPATPAVATPTAPPPARPIAQPPPPPADPARAAAPASRPAAEVAAAAAPAEPAALGLDAAIGLIGSGQAGRVVPQLPQLIKRLLPLFKLLNARQRAQLIAYLAKLGG